MSAPLCSDCKWVRGDRCGHPSNLNAADGRPNDYCRTQRSGTGIFALIFGCCGPRGWKFEPKETP